MKRWRIEWTTPSGARLPLGVVPGLTEGGALRRARLRHPLLPRSSVLHAQLMDQPSSIGLPTAKPRPKKPQGFACPHVQAKAHSPDAEAKRQATRAKLTPGQKRWRDLRRRRQQRQRPPSKGSEGASLASHTTGGE